MAIQYSLALRNGQLDVIDLIIGASPTLEIRTGSKPLDTASADGGTLLASLPLPADWMEAASNGTVVKKGSWADPSADAAGVAGHFRIKAGSVCHIQGSIGMPGSGQDMILDNTNIATGQSVTVLTFSIGAGNA
jgi:hypothetical protein